jgi:pimeloyl-ACP methyl ester carboxylesterase
MEDRIGAIRQPTLLVRAPGDPFAASHAAQWLAHLPHAQVVDIEGGMVPLPDQLPQAFAGAVLRFLGSISGTTRHDGG